MKNLKKYMPYLLAAIAVVLTIILLLLSGMEKQNTKERYTATYFDSFDTVTQIIGYADSEEEFYKNANLLNEKLIYYHKLYTIYSHYPDINNIRTINFSAGKEPVVVDKEIIDLLKFSKEMYTLTDGKMNIAMGSVLSIWHNYRNNGINNPETASLPPIEELQAAALHTDINNIIIDEDASTVYLADPEMSLDVGSIGKGYAVQKVAEYAKKLGMNNLVLNVGGNVISIGAKGDGEDWVLGIQNPDLEAENSAIETVSFKDLCLVTSGDYQRYYTVDGVNYNHIINPETLMPATYFSAVSIITDHSGKADALSTALFNMSYEDGLALIESLEGTEAFWVFKDGSTKHSNNFKNYIAK